MQDKNAKLNVLETMPVREVVAVVHSEDQLISATDQLMAAGIDRADIDLMADRNTILRKLGKYYYDPSEIADNPDVPRQALILREELTEGAAGAFGVLFYLGALSTAGAVVASGGAVAAAALAALAGGAVTGGLGAAFAHNLTAEKMRKLKFDLLSGGILLFVRVRNNSKEQKALNVLEAIGADNVHVHEIQLSKTVADIPLSQINPDPWLGNERLGDVC